MTEALALDQINKQAYSATGVVDWYRDFDFLLKPEKVLLQKIRPEIEGQRLLDIGIGSGRTTKHLLEISSDYTGIDYIAECRSEEHTSELQSQSNLVCRLLLEQKKIVN